jgi:hypothetical protein
LPSLLSSSPSFVTLTPLSQSLIDAILDQSSALPLQSLPPCFLPTILRNLGTCAQTERYL